MKIRILVYSVLIMLVGCTDDTVNNSVKIEQKVQEYETQISELRLQLDEVKNMNTDLKKSVDSLSKTSRKTFDVTNIEEIIKDHTSIADSIEFIAYRQYGARDLQHVYAFVDYNLNSKFHASLNRGYGFSNEEERKQYESYFRNTLDIELDTALLHKYIGNWTPLYSYKGEFYNYYSHCDFRDKGFTLSDSTFTHYYMDGLSPSTLTKIVENNNKIEIHIGNSMYLLELIDPERLIYIYTEGRRKQYVIPQSEIKKFPIMVEDCHETGGGIIRFDKILE